MPSSSSVHWRGLCPKNKKKGRERSSLTKNDKKKFHSTSTHFVTTFPTPSLFFFERRQQQWTVLGESFQNQKEFGQKKIAKGYFIGPIGTGTANPTGGRVRKAPIGITPTRSATANAVWCSVTRSSDSGSALGCYGLCTGA